MGRTPAPFSVREVAADVDGGTVRSGQDLVDRSVQQRVERVGDRTGRRVEGRDVGAVEGEAALVVQHLVEESTDDDQVSDLGDRDDLAPAAAPVPRTSGVQLTGLALGRAPWFDVWNA